MERRVTGAFTQVLRDGRERFNAAFAAARRGNRNLDEGEFMEHLAERVMPVVNAAAESAEDRAFEIGAALFDISLALFAGGCLGSRSRSTLVDRAWHEILPGIPHLVAADPRGTATAVSNAAYNLSLEKNADGDGWIRRIQSIGEHLPDPATFRKAGVIAAWRCGLAHYREGALSACENVPLPILRRIFDTGKDVDDARMMKLLQRMAADPWSTTTADTSPPPKREPAIVRICGGFRGFGGVFIQPPLIQVVDGKFNAYDGEFQWRLSADAFGATLHRLAQGKPSGGSIGDERFTIDLKGKVTFRSTQTMFSELRGSLSHAATENTLAISLPHSHKIHLIACVPEGTSTLTERTNK